MKLKYLDPQISTVNLNGWWKLYEQTYFDYSLNGNNGTATDTEVADRGILFDGADSLVTVTADTTLDANGKSVFSVSAWINPASDGEGNLARIVNKTDATVATTGYNVYLSAEAGGFIKLGMLIQHANVDASAISNAAVIPINQWSHVVGTYNEDSDGKIKLYYDGSLLALGTDTAGNVAGTPSDDSADNFIIGNTTAKDRTFDGVISDVQFYNAALSAAQAKSIYEVTRGRYGA